MSKVVPKIRIFLLAIAVMIVIGSMVPAYTAPAPLGPCFDEGCPGGSDFCDYVKLDGEWRPCNLGAIIIDDIR